MMLIIIEKTLSKAWTIDLSKVVSEAFSDLLARFFKNCFFHWIKSQVKKITSFASPRSSFLPAASKKVFFKFFATKFDENPA